MAKLGVISSMDMVWSPKHLQEKGICLAAQQTDRNGGHAYFREASASVASTERVEHCPLEQGNPSLSLSLSLSFSFSLSQHPLLYILGCSVLAWSYPLMSLREGDNKESPGPWLLAPGSCPLLPPALLAPRREGRRRGQGVLER